MTWAEKIRQFREEHPEPGRARMSQGALAQSLGVRVQTIENWEHDRTASVGFLREMVEIRLTEIHEAYIKAQGVPEPQ